MKNHIFALAAAALLSGTAAVWAQGLPQDQSQSPKTQTKDQMARPDAQPGVGEDQKGSAGGNDQSLQGPNREDRNLQRTQTGGDRDRVQGEERGPQGGEMLRGGETMRGGTHAKLTIEQKTNLRTTVLRAGPRLTHVNFHIGVGVRIPHTVRLVAVPQEILAIYPEWANYEYFAYGDEIVIVDPATLAIISVLAL